MFVFFRETMYWVVCVGMGVGYVCECVLDIAMKMHINMGKQ